MAKTKRLVQWFGANTEHAEKPGRLLGGCRFIGVPFAGGMSEVPFFAAKQILVNDLHQHIINLCRCIQDDYNRNWLIEQAGALPYHPSVLGTYQEFAEVDFDFSRPNLNAALAYFVCVWMGRGGQAGTPAETKGNLPIRWNASGGGANRRYRTAIEALDEWGKAFKRCEFTCMDALDFLARFPDVAEHGIFCDPNWPDAGDEYVHTLDEVGQRRLAALLADYKNAQIVVRFGEHPLIRELYDEKWWRWIPLESRNQANARKPEFLICNWEI